MVIASATAPGTVAGLFILGQAELLSAGAYLPTTR